MAEIRTFVFDDEEEEDDDEIYKSEMTYLPITAIFRVKDAVTRDFTVVPSNCQLRT